MKEEDLRLGEMLGKGLFHWFYFILGGFATVFRGLYKGEIVAVKVLNTNDPLKTKEFETEIDNLRRLDHPRIVKFVYLISFMLFIRYKDMLISNDPPKIHILLEHMAGGSITSMLKEYGPFPLELVRKYTAQVTEGLTFLHEKGIAHRDVKGANVLIDNKGDAKLSDLGASKNFIGGTLSGPAELFNYFQGSIFWMDPLLIENVTAVAAATEDEVPSDTATAAVRVGRKGDVWSLGCTVLEMLTGTHPWPSFEGLPPMQVMKKILDAGGSPPFPFGLPDDAKDFLQSCLSRDYSTRKTSRELLKHRFLQPYFAKHAIKS